MEHDNNIIIGEDFTPELVAHALIHAYVEKTDNLGSRLEQRFSDSDLKGIANYLISHVEDSELNRIAKNLIGNVEIK